MTKLKEYSSEICHLRMGMMILLFLMRMTTLFVINCKTPTGNSRTLEEEHVNDEKVVDPEDDGHHVIIVIFTHLHHDSGEQSHVGGGAAEGCSKGGGQHQGYGEGGNDDDHDDDHDNDYDDDHDDANLDANVNSVSSCDDLVRNDLFQPDPRPVTTRPPTPATTR